MPFGTSDILDSFTGADENPITTNWTAPIELGATAQMRYLNRLGGWGTGQAYYDLAQFGPDCEAYYKLDTLPGDNYNLTLWTNISGQGTAAVTCYRGSIVRVSGSWEYGIRRINAGVTTHLEVDLPVGYTFVNGDWFGMEVIANVISLYYKPAAGSWTKFADYDDSGAADRITSVGYVGAALDWGGCYVDDFGAGTVNQQILRPDADTADGGWTTTPLYSKVNDDQDGTYITASAS